MPIQFRLYLNFEWNGYKLTTTWGWAEWDYLCVQFVIFVLKFIRIGKKRCWVFFFYSIQCTPMNVNISIRHCNFTCFYLSWIQLSTILDRVGWFTYRNISGMLLYTVCSSSVVQMHSINDKVTADASCIYGIQNVYFSPNDYARIIKCVSKNKIGLLIYL